MLFDKSHPPINDEIVSTLEQAINVKFPSDYKQFLSHFNGGIPNKTNFNFIQSIKGSVLNGFFGFVTEKRLNILFRMSTTKSRIPKNTFPIADDQCGNLILLSVKGPDYGKVYFWDHELEADEGEEATYSNLTLIAHSFDEFLSMLKSEEEIDALLNEKDSS